MNNSLPVNNTVHRLFSTIETDGFIKANDGTNTMEASWFTPWSIAHLVGGSLVRGMGGSLVTLLIFHTMYEFLQHTDEKAKEKWRSEGYPWFYGDSIQNSIGDTISTVLGWIFFDKMINLGKQATLISSVVLLTVGYVFLSPRVQKNISYLRKEYMKNAYNLSENSEKSSKIRYINFFGEKLPLPYSLGLFIGLGLIILYATDAYYPVIIG